MKSFLRKLDYRIAHKHFKKHGEKNSLLIFLFHAFLTNRNEITSGLIRPQLSIDAHGFRYLIEYYRSCGYTFICPEDIVNGLEETKKYALITFDDGYYNNIRALPLLREYNAPAVFFVTTGNVTENHGFWWDILYREEKKRGKTDPYIFKAGAKLKSKTTSEIEAILVESYGKKSLYPIGDLDRSFTPQELADFSREKLVYIGNHTKEHAILTNYTREQVKSQIAGAQLEIKGITAQEPIIIAYPNGNYNREIIDVCRDCGLQLGVTVEPKKNYLPLDFKSGQNFELGRYMIEGGNNLINHCEAIRADFSFYNSLKMWRKRQKC